MIIRRPIEEQLQSALSFIQIHEAILHKIDDNSRPTVFENVDTHTRPIKVQLDPFERVLPQDIINTDNELIKKIFTVLVFLCDEISQLKEIAETRFYRPLLMFGHTPLEPIDNNDKKKYSHENKYTDPGYLLFITIL